jgi:macrolide-specific efflux system membrane fusion protein
MRLPLAIWGNRLGKAAIIAVVVATVGGTGWLAGHGAASPAPVRDSLPTADLTPREIPVEEGLIVSRLTVDAVVHADPPIQVHSEKGGSVTQVYRKVGREVHKGDPIMAIKSMPDGGGTSSPGGGGSTSTSKSAPKPVTRVLHATANGKISEVLTPVGKEVAPGDAVVSIDQGKFHAVASIDSQEVYKLYNRPKSIKLAIDHGPAPFNCKLIDYGAGTGGATTGSGGSVDKSGSSPSSGDGSGGSGASGSDGVQVTCRIPASQRVFSGIQAKMSITTDSVSGAVIIPLSAVLGQADKGRVTVVTDGGKREVRTVKLGINDGTKVQVVDGLKAGEKILDRAPEDPAFSGPPQQSGGGPNGQPGGLMPSVAP